MKKTLRDYKKDFAAFVESIPENLEKARKLLGLETLTYSYEEVDRMKDIYENNYKNPKKLGLSHDELAAIFDPDGARLQRVPPDGARLQRVPPNN